MNKKLLIGVALLAVVGCNSGKKQATTTGSSAVDIQPAPLPPPAVVDTTPIARPAAETTKVSNVSTISGSKYTVQKGDTLWSIANKKYGDGKQYKKIQSANNLKGDSIQVGQTLTLP